MSDDLERLWSRYARVWGWVTLAVLIGVSLFLTFSGQFFGLGSGANSYLKAIGGSLLASVAFYALVSIFLEPKVRALEARRVSNFAIQVANQQFYSRFQVSLPQAVFGDSELPKSEFSRAFAALLNDSSRYDFKGASAVFAAFRLATLKWRPEIQRLEEVRLRLADPRNDAMMRAHARIMRAEQRGGSKTIEQFQEQLRLDIAVSLVALFDIRAERPSAVYFHTDLPLFRCEMFDGGMFLSYYSFNLGRSAYPEALQYPRETRPYQAYRQGLELTRECASCVLAFRDEGASADTISKPDQLTEWLQRLGLNQDLDALRNHRSERFELLTSRLGKAGLDPKTMF